jgi:outer membrane protein assembly factor BamB
MPHPTTKLLLTTTFLAALTLGCQDAVSPAAPLVTGERGVTAIAVDDFFLYWSKADGTVRKVSLDGGQITTLASGQNLPDHVAVDDGRVYWATGDGAVKAVSKDGGGEIHIAVDAEITGLTVDEAHVYWTAAASDGSLRRASKSEDDSAAVTLASGLSGPRSPRVHSGGVFWADQGWSSSAGALMRVPAEGGEPKALIGEPEGALSLAVTGDELYWTTFGDGTVRWASLGGGDAHVIATEQGVLQAVAGDGVTVYWTRADGTVNMAPLYGGEPVEIAKGPANAKVSLAIDATSIYWANSQSGTLMAMPKP